MATPVRKYECGVDGCMMSFAHKKELKNHLAVLPHRKMKVVCILCQTFSAFTRVSDLKRHCENTKNHKEELKNLPSDFLSEGNASWMALYPDIYRRVVSPPKWSSEISRKTRDLVLKWARNLKNPLKDEEEWRRCWETLRDDKDVLILSTDGSITPTPEEYDPANPAINVKESTVLREVVFGQGSVVAWFECGTDRYTYEVFLHRNVLGNDRSKEILRRRGQCVPTDKFYKPSTPGRCLEGLELQTKRNQFSKALGLDLECVEKIVTWDSPFQPLGCQEMSHEEKDQSSQRLPSPGDLSPTINTEFLSMPLICTSPVPSPKTGKRRIILSSPSPSKRPCRSNGNTHQLQKDIERKGSPQTEAAKNILRTGCMPLLPPSRREWDPESDVVLRVGTSSIRWPPRNWISLDHDQRLLMWEYAAMKLEEGVQRKIPSIHRHFLLDKYNMLALPGTKDLKVDNNIHATTRKSRLYNYKMVIDIATGKDSSAAVIDIINMFTSAQSSRNKDTDDVIKNIEKAGIPLRLEATSSTE